MGRQRLWGMFRLLALCSWLAIAGGTPVVSGAPGVMEQPAPTPQFCGFASAAFIECYFNRKPGEAVRALYDSGLAGTASTFADLENALAKSGLVTAYKSMTLRDLRDSDGIGIRYLEPFGGKKVGHFQVVLSKGDGTLTVVDAPHLVSQINVGFSQTKHYPVLMVSDPSAGKAAWPASYRLIVFGAMTAVFLFFARRCWPNQSKEAKSK